jgi:hypothetical protein
MKYDVITDQDVPEIIRQTVLRAQDRAFRTVLAVANGTIPEGEDARLEEVAAKLEAQAKKVGIEGPFLDDAGRKGILKDALRTLEAEHASAALHSAAGVEGFDESAVEERIAKVKKAAGA